MTKVVLHSPPPEIRFPQTLGDMQRVSNVSSTRQGKLFDDEADNNAFQLDTSKRKGIVVSSKA